MPWDWVRILDRVFERRCGLCTRQDGLLFSHRRGRKVGDGCAYGANVRFLGWSPCGGGHAYCFQGTDSPVVSLLRGDLGRDSYDGDGPCAYRGSYCVHDVLV